MTPHDPSPIQGLTEGKQVSVRPDSSNVYWKAQLLWGAENPNWTGLLLICPQSYLKTDQVVSIQLERVNSSKATHDKMGEDTLSLSVGK